MNMGHRWSHSETKTGNTREKNLFVHHKSRKYTVYILDEAGTSTAYII